MFVDPASISTGWTYTVGKDIISHGTIRTEKTNPVFKRLAFIWTDYRLLIVDGSLDEVHIEQLPRRCHIYTHWSVAVIGHALSKYTFDIYGDIPVKAWQKHVNWKEVQNDWKGSSKMKSEDEWASYCMARWYLETKF